MAVVNSPAERKRMAAVRYNSGVRRVCLWSFMWEILVVGDWNLLLFYDTFIFGNNQWGIMFVGGVEVFSMERSRK